MGYFVVYSVKRFAASIYVDCDAPKNSSFLSVRARVLCTKDCLSRSFASISLSRHLLGVRFKSRTAAER